MCVTYAVMRQAAGEALRLRICLFHCSKRFFAMQRFSRSERRDTDAARRTPKPSAAQNCPTTVFSSENGPQAAFSAFPSRQSAKRRRPDACLSALETVRSQRISIFFQKTLDFLLHPCYDNEAVSQEAHGVLAQLGERHTGSVEVSGSIPLCSTKSDPDEHTADPLYGRRCVRFGLRVTKMKKGWRTESLYCVRQPLCMFIYSAHPSLPAHPRQPS